MWQPSWISDHDLYHIQFQKHSVVFEKENLKKTQSTWIFSYGGYAEYQIDIKITKYDAVNERSIPTNFVSIWLSSFTEDVSIGWLWRRQAQSDDNYPHGPLDQVR